MRFIPPLEFCQPPLLTIPGYGAVQEQGAVEQSEGGRGGGRGKGRVLPCLQEQGAVEQSEGGREGGRGKGRVPPCLQEQGAVEQSEGEREGGRGKGRLPPCLQEQGAVEQSEGGRGGGRGEGSLTSMSSGAGRRRAERSRGAVAKPSLRMSGQWAPRTGRTSGEKTKWRDDVSEVSEVTRRFMMIAGSTTCLPRRNVLLENNHCSRTR